MLIDKPFLSCMGVITKEATTSHNIGFISCNLIPNSFPSMPTKKLQRITSGNLDTIKFHINDYKVPFKKADTKHYHPYWF